MSVPFAVGDEGLISRAEYTPEPPHLPRPERRSQPCRHPRLCEPQGGV